MTTKDLMIGDYVTFKDCQNNDAPTIVKIEGLGYQGRGVVEEALVSIDGDAAFDLVEINEEFVGIPLTEEILKKNGFEKISLKSGQVVYSLADDYYDLEAEEITDSIWRIEYFNVEASFPSCRELVCFVHEIQHFLNSHKIEKEIKL